MLISFAGLCFRLFRKCQMALIGLSELIAGIIVTGTFNSVSASDKNPVEPVITLKS